MSETDTLGKHLDILTRKERGYIMFMLNNYNILGYQIHLGMLPFVKMKLVAGALQKILEVESSIPGCRTAAVIAAKLKKHRPDSNVTTWVMQLSSAKVARRFGAHPERGHKIPCLTNSKRVTVGIRWNLPKKDFEPDDNVLVHPHVVLKPVMGKHSMWQITCEKLYQSHVSTWLMDYCR